MAKKKPLKSSTPVRQLPFEDVAPQSAKPDTEVTLSQLESHPWKADILRGPLNAADFKTCMFPLLFFKRTSDVHDEEYRAALSESDGDEEYVMFPQNYCFQIPRDCHWDDVRKVAQLARLELPDDKIATYTSQLERILDYVDHLQAVDTEGVPPTTRAVEVVNVTRDDVVVPTAVREQLLDEAPQREGDFFRVPKILAD